MLAHQSRADKSQGAEEKHSKLVEKMGGAKEYIEQYGGDTVAAATKNYATLRNSTEFGEIIQAFERTGQLPERNGSAPKVEEEDEYKTPEQIEINALKTEMNQLRTRQGAQTLTSGRETLQRHIEDVFVEYGITGTDADTARQAMTAQFESWGAMGSVGESALDSIMAPNGKKTVQGIMLASISPEALLKAAQNVDLRKKQGLSNLTTDGPSGDASAGKEPPPKFQSAIEAANYAREGGAHDSY